MKPCRSSLRLRLSDLEDARIDEAYPLVRSARGASSAQWRDFIGALRAAGGGLVAATAADGCIHGVAAWRPGFCLIEGPVLVIDLVAAMEMGSPARVRPALCRALERMARVRQCGALVYARPTGRAIGPDSAAVLRWGELDLEPASRLYVHRLARKARKARALAATG